MGRTSVRFISVLLLATVVGVGPVAASAGSAAGRSVVSAPAFSAGTLGTLAAGWQWIVDQVIGKAIHGRSVLAPATSPSDLPSVPPPGGGAAPGADAGQSLDPNG
jgi:hypothetical protein